jgi:GT2 family glycosyltransferase
VIYILVPTFARVDDTKKFLTSLQNSIHQDYLVLITDDHPDKVTLQSIEQNDKIRVLVSEDELWWVGSINLGIKTLFDTYNLKDDDLVVFANNDVQMNQKSFELLYNELQKEKNQIVHPRTFDQDGTEVSSGTKIISFFPYITIHPKNFEEEKRVVDTGAARFLMMGGSVLKQVGLINQELIQYLGDDDFTLSAKRDHKIYTYILRDATCLLDNTETGMNNTNIQTIQALYKSFFSIRSPNNIKYRFRLFKKFFGSFFAIFIVFSMTLNSITKYILNKIR